MSRVLVAINELPGVIRESARTALSAHGFAFCDRDGRPLSVERSERLLNELARNVAQGIVSLDRAASEVFEDLGIDPLGGSDDADGSVH